jgi:hypothetical protein
MTTIPGADYSSGHPGGAALAAAGKKFAARYVSHSPAKNITLTEATDLAAHGVSVVVVWETTANRAAAGRSAGIADAHDALTQATAAGMPNGRPIYFAVDWDADPTVVVPYFQGVASVLGVARTGVYGGYKVVRYLLDHGLAHWAWQTVAWSGGLWDTRAVIRQYATQTRINSVDCDLDTATAADYGQWMPDLLPEEDMPLTDADVTKVATKVWAHTAPSPTAAKGTDPDRSMETYARYADARHAQTTAAIGALTGMVTALTTAVQAGGGLTVEQATAAATAGAEAALAQLGDALTS